MAQRQQMPTVQVTNNSPQPRVIEGVLIQPNETKPVALNEGARKLAERMGVFTIGSGSRPAARQSEPVDQAAASNASDRQVRARALADSIEKKHGQEGSISYEAALPEAQEILGDDWSFETARPGRAKLVAALRAL